VIRIFQGSLFKNKKY